MDGQSNQHYPGYHAPETDERLFPEEGGESLMIVNF
jgi:hypothetical protein